MNSKFRYRILLVKQINDFQQEKVGQEVIIRKNNNTGEKKYFKPLDMNGVEMYASESEEFRHANHMGDILEVHEFIDWFMMGIFVFNRINIPLSKYFSALFEPHIEDNDVKIFIAPSDYDLSTNFNFEV